MSSKPCSGCGADFPIGAKFCMECGSAPPAGLAEPKPAPAAAARPSTCKSCGAELPAAAKFCPECGAKPSGAAPPPAVGDVSGPSCAKCNMPVGGQILTALNKSWHPECFVCSQCARPFGSPSFVVRSGQPWCDSCVDWDAKEKRAGRAGLGGGAAPPYAASPAAPAPARAPAADDVGCAGCGQLITGISVVYRDEYYHKGWLNCAPRKQPIDTDKGFVTKSNQPYHGDCAKSIDKDFPLDKVCTGCQKPIGNRFVKPDGHLYHPDCFVCADCRGSLMQGYVVKGGKNYCGPCARKVASAPAASRAEPVVAPGQAGVRYNQFTGQVTASYDKPKENKEASAPAAKAAAPAAVATPRASAAAPAGKPTKCKRCFADAPAGARACGECGFKLPVPAKQPEPEPQAPAVAPPSKFCPDCGAAHHGGGKFCGECGSIIA